MSLQTWIADIPLQNPLMNASGCLCGTGSQLNALENSRAAVVVSKSATINPQIGNDGSRLYLDEFGAINSMGNPNLGYQYYVDHFSSKHDAKPHILSIYPYNPEELKTMIFKISTSKTFKTIFELNVSCPNVGIDNNFDTYEKYFDIMSVLGMSDQQVWGVKLPPFFHKYEFEHMSRMLLKYRPNFITSINTVPRGLILDPKTLLPRIVPYNGLGGISGKYIKPIGLSNVYQFSTLLDRKIDIIGCGGISSGQDVLEYMAAGACAVQIGSHLIREGVECFQTIEKELVSLVNDRPITDFIGRARAKM